MNILPAKNSTTTQITTQIDIDLWIKINTPISDEEIQMVRDLINLPIPDQGRDTVLSQLETYFSIRYWRMPAEIQTDIRKWLFKQKIEYFKVWFLEKDFELQSLQEIKKINQQANLKVIDIFQLNRIVLPKKINFGFLTSIDQSLNSDSPMELELANLILNQWRTLSPSQIQFLVAITEEGKVLDLTGEWTSCSDWFEVAEEALHNLEGLSTLLQQENELSVSVIEIVERYIFKHGLLSKTLKSLPTAGRTILALGVSC